MLMRVLFIAVLVGSEVAAEKDRNSADESAQATAMDESIFGRSDAALIEDNQMGDDDDSAPIDDMNTYDAPVATTTAPVQLSQYKLNEQMQMEANKKAWEDAHKATTPAPTEPTVSEADQLIDTIKESVADHVDSTVTQAAAALLEQKMSDDSNQAASRQEAQAAAPAEAPAQAAAPAEIPQMQAASTASQDNSAEIAVRNANTAGVGNLRTAVNAYASEASIRREDLWNKFKKGIESRDTILTAASKVVMESHKQNERDFQKAKPEIEAVIAKARPILTEAKSTYATQNLGTAQKIKASRNHFDLSAAELQASYLGTQGTARAERSKLVSALQTETNKANLQQSKDALVYSVNADKYGRGKLEAFEKIQGMATGTFDQTEEQLGDLVDNVETTGEDVDNYADEVEGNVELLEENGDPANPGIENAMEHADSVFDEFRKESNTDIRDLGARMQDMGVKLSDDAEKQQEQAAEDALQGVDMAEATVSDFEIDSEKATKIMGLKLTKQAEKAMKVQQQQIPKMVPVEKNLDANLDGLEEFQTSNQELVEKYHDRYDNMVTVFNDKYQEQLTKDNNELIGSDTSYLANTKNLLIADSQEKVAGVLSQGQAKVQQAEMAFDSFLAGSTTNLENTKATLDGQEVSVASTEKKIEEMGKKLATHNEPLKWINRIHAEFDAHARELRGTGSTAGMYAKSKIGSMSERAAAAVNGIVASAQSGLSEAQNDVSTGIQTDASTVMHDVNMLSQKGVKTSSEIKGKMRTKNLQMKESEKAYEKAENFVKRVPGDIRIFKDDYNGRIASENFKIQSTGEKLTQKAKIDFNTAFSDSSAKIDAVRIRLGSKIMADSANVQKQADALSKQVQKVSQSTVSDREERLKAQQTITDKNQVILSNIKAFGPQIAAGVERTKTAIDDTMKKIAFEMKNQESSRDKVTKQTEITSGKDEDSYQENIDNVLDRFGRKTTDEMNVLGGKLADMQQEDESTFTANKRTINRKINKINGGVIKDVSDQVNALDHIFVQSTVSSSLQAAQNAITSAESGAKKADYVMGALNDNADRIAAEMRQTVDTAAAGFVQQREGVKDTISKGVTKLRESEQAGAEAFFNKLGNTEQAAGASLTNMQSENFAMTGELQGANRDMRAGAAALAEKLASQAGDVSDAIRSEMNSVDSAAGDAQNEAKHARQDVETVTRQLERNAAAMEKESQQMERDVEGEIEKLNPTKDIQKLSEEVAELKSHQKQDLTDTASASEGAIDIMAKLLTNTNDKIESLGKRVSNANKNVAKVYTDVPKKIGAVAEDLQKDDSSVNRLLLAMHDVSTDLQAHVKERKEVVKEFHEKNERQLASMQGMSAYEGADALDGVLQGLDKADALDNNLNGIVMTQIHPQTEHWRAGVEQIFSNLGLDLDMDKIAAEAEARMNGDRKGRSEIAHAGTALDELLRATSMLAKEKQNQIEKKMRADIDAIMNDNNLSREEKEARIKQIKDAAARESQMLMQMAKRMASNQDNAGLTLAEQSRLMSELMTRARMAAAAAANPMQREELVNEAFKIHKGLRDVSNMVNPIQSGKPGSLIEEGDLSKVAATNAKAARTFEATTVEVAKIFREDSSERDAKEAQWESLLDGLDGGLGAEKTMRRSM